MAFIDSKRHQSEIDLMKEKAITAWNWNLGVDLNPALLSTEVVDEAYEAVRSAIRDDLDNLARKVGMIGYSQNTMRAKVFPAIWKTFSAAGVMVDFDGGELVSATPKHLRGRLLKDDQLARTMYNRWHSENENIRHDKRITKQENQIVWNADCFEAMGDLCSDWLATGGGDARNDRHACARMTLAVCWFTGRRPWAEAALHAEFASGQGMEWADDWLTVTGLAKKTKAVAEGREEERQISIPVFGITAPDFLEGFERLRELEASQGWFQPDNVKGHEFTKNAMNYYCQEEIKGVISSAFSPVLEAGYPMRLEVKMFRALFVSQGQWKQEKWCMANGHVMANINAYAKRYIGHFGLSSEQDTAEYLRFTYIGDQEIPALL